MIRQRQSPSETYEPKKHVNEYPKLADFVINYTQQQMVQKYNLEEVWIPENKHVEE